MKSLSELRSTLCSIIAAAALPVSLIVVPLRVHAEEDPTIPVTVVTATCHDRLRRINSEGAFVSVATTVIRVWGEDGCASSSDTIVVLAVEAA